MMSKILFINTIILSAIFLAGCTSNEEGDFEVAFDNKIEHIHGIGYAGETNGLYFATHGGLKIYCDSEGYETTRNYNDYMGFNAVDEGFYTSGHPGGDSDIPNPFGIQRSFDGGRTLEHIKFEGETDYHAMAVGYDSHDIFLMNPERNPELEKGFYRSVDEGETWEEVDAEGLEGGVLSFAMHPADSNFVAAATSEGIYLSKNGGNDFKVLTDAGHSGTAVYFFEDDLYYATYGESVKLVKRSVRNDDKVAINIPKMNDDGILYIARNPRNTEELGIYTINGDAYLSKDGSVEQWGKILNDGNAK